MLRLGEAGADVVVEREGATEVSVGLTRRRRTRGGERGGGIGTGSWSVDNRTRSSGGCVSVGGGGVAVVALLRKATAATVVTPALLATFLIGSSGGEHDGGSGAGSGGSIGGEMWLVLVLHCEN